MSILERGRVVSSPVVAAGVVASPWGVAAASSGFWTFTVVALFEPLRLFMHQTTNTMQSGMKMTTNTMITIMAIPSPGGETVVTVVELILIVVSSITGGGVISLGSQSSPNSPVRIL